MGKSVLRVQRSEAAEIKKMIRENEAYTVGVRLYLVYLVAMGHSSRKLAELHNISFKQITNWVHRFESDGIEGLKDKKGRGRHSILTAGQLERIRVLVLNEAPKKYGIQSSKWTGPLLVEWIKKEYGVQYQKAQIYNLLNRMGIAFEKKQGLVES